MNPLGYHLVNLLLHAAGAALLWRVLKRLLVPGAWWAAAVFAVHPVCVASVAWIAERKNTLSLVFFLLSLLWYLRFEAQSESGGRESGGRNRNPASSHLPAVPAPWLCYALSLLAFLLALLSKTSVVTLPFVLVLCVWWLRTGASRATQSGPRPAALDVRLWLRLAPFFLLSLLFGLVTVWFQSHRAMGGAGAHGDSLLVRLLGGSWAVWFYLWKALWPVRLAMIYPRWEINPASPFAYLPALLLLGAVFLGWRFRRTSGRPVLFGLGYFLVMLWPVLGFFDMSFFVYARAADHLQYLALIGVISLTVGGLSAGWQGFRFQLGAGLAVIVLSLLTWERAGVYAGQETLWRDNLARNPQAWAAYNNLGNAAADPDEALRYYQAALHLKPDYALAWNNVGAILYAQGKLAEAAAHFQEAVGLQPGYPDAHNNLGLAWLDQGKQAEALAEFDTALRLRPDYADAHNNLGRALAEQGKLAEARVQFMEALRLNPDYADAHGNLARLLLAQGNAEQAGEAIAQFRETLRLKPDWIEALNNLAWMLATLPDAKLRNGAEALRLAGRAVELTNTNNPGALDTLGAAYAEAGRFPEAVACGEKAVALAETVGQTNVAAGLRAHLRLYQSSQPVRQPD
jgi:tetratricopeptide (TPR) repeat protein